MDIICAASYQLNTHHYYQNNIKIIERDVLESSNQLHKLEVNRSELQQLEENMKNNRQIQEKISEIESELRKNQSKLVSVESELNIKKSQFVSDNTKMGVLKEDIKMMKKIEKELDLYNYYSVALKALPYILIEKVRPVLEKKINDLLSVTTNFMVKIEIENTSKYE